MPNIETITTKGVVYNVVDTGARDTINNLSEVARTGSFNNLTDLPTVNGQVLKGDITIQTGSNSVEYTAGNGISLVNNTISVDFDTVAKKSDIPTVNYPVTSVNGQTGDVNLEIPEQITYTGGDGISISGNTISADFNTVARKSDIPTVNYPVTSVNGQTGDVVIESTGGGVIYTGSDTIDISSSNVVSLKIVNDDGFIVLPGGISLDFSYIATQGHVTSVVNTLLNEKADLIDGKVPIDQLPEIGGTTYTEGEGIAISDTNEISVDFDTVARKSDIPTVNYPVTSVNGQTGDVDISNIIMPGTAISIDSSGSQRIVSLKFSDTTGIITGGLTGGMALDFDVVAKKDYVDGLVGDISTVLDEINGEEV